MKLAEALKIIENKEVAKELLKTNNFNVKPSLDKNYE